LPVIGEEEILPTVVVIIAHAHALGPSGIGEPGFGGDVGEGAVAIIVVEPVTGAGRSSDERAPSENEDIHPAVVVVVEKGAAGGHGFDDVGKAVGLAVDDRLCEAGGLGYIDKPGEGRGGFLLRDGCAQPAGYQSRSQGCGRGAQQTAARPKTAFPLARHVFELLARKIPACFSAGSG